MTTEAPSPSRRLVILRHAKSDWPPGVPDRLRPLSERGIGACATVGRFLSERAILADVVVASPAVRTMETARLVVESAGSTTPVTTDPALYGGPLRATLALVRRQSPGAVTVMLVGHEPELLDLLAELTGSRVRLPTAGLAVVAVPGSWAQEPSHAAELRLLTTPKLLR